MNEELLFLGKTIESVQKMRVAADVRISHLSKNKKKCRVTELITDQEKRLEGLLNDELKGIMEKHPTHGWSIGIKGVGLINLGKVVSFIDIERATNISKLWRYCGFACDENGNAERATKGQKLHFNRQLKSLCWRLGKSLIRAKGKYYAYYREEKTKLEQRETGKGRKIVPSNKLPKVNGKHIETDEFIGKGHVDNMALRKMIKLFLSHLWMIWREEEGLPITNPYVHDIGGHANFIDPLEMLD